MISVWRSSSIPAVSPAGPAPMIMVVFRFSGVFVLMKQDIGWPLNVSGNGGPLQN